MKAVKLFLTLLALIMLAIFSGCLSNSSDENIFFNAAQNFAPKFTEAIPEAIPAHHFKSKNSESTSWQSNNAMYEMWNLLREFDPEIHYGVIDGSNMYMTLHSSGELYNNARSECAGNTIDLRIITPPINIDFGNNTQYDHLCNSSSTGTASGETNTYTYYYALREEGLEEAAAEAAAAAATAAHEEDATVEIGATGNESYFLEFSGFTSDTGTKQYEVLEAYRDPNTFDVEIDSSYIMLYNDGTTYGVHLELSGNELTHAFTLKLRTENTNDTSGICWITMAGKGISKGEGNYFLFKLDNGCGGYDNATGERYFVFPVGATIDTLKATDQTGVTYDNIDENGAPYKEDVQAMTLFTADDFAESEEDYNSGSITLSY